MSVGKSHKYSQKLMEAIRWTGLIVMLVQSLYWVVACAITGHSVGMYTLSAFDTDLSWVPVAMFLMLGLYGFYKNPRTYIGLRVMLAGYYLAVAYFVVFISGDPVISNVMWLVLLIATSVALGLGSLAIGSAFVLAMASLNWITLLPDFDMAKTLSVTAGSILVVLAAGYVAYLRTIGAVQLGAYEQLKSREKAQTRRLETVINSINDAVLNVSSRGQVRLYNAATLALLDTNEDINGKDADSIFRLTNENGEKILISDLMKDTRQVLEREDLRHEYSDGQKISIYLSISHIRGTFDTDGSSSNLGGVIIIVRDITKQKSLDDERDEFISVVSHELRTPVAIAEGTLSNIAFALSKKGGDPATVESVEQAHKEVLFLSEMVNDLSTLSRAQRGVSMDPELIDIKTLIQDLYNKYVSEAESRKLHLDIDLGITGNIMTPRMAIEEIMQNLITNSFKYTKTGGVTIGTRDVSTRQKEKIVEFFVKDTGIGISKSDQSHVFQRFWRSEDYRTRETSGTGLGLHVTEKLAVAIKTKIELTSRINHGSMFSFRLPLADDTAEPQAKS